MCSITIDIIRLHCSSITIPIIRQFIYHQRDVTVTYDIAWKCQIVFQLQCSIVTVSWGRGGVCVWGGGVQVYIFFYFIFFSFCRDLALNHVNFHFPAMFFSPALLSFEQCTLWWMNGLQYYFLPTVFQSYHVNVKVIRKGYVQWTTFAFRPQGGRGAQALEK